MLEQLVVWRLDLQSYALPLSVVDQVVRAVAVTQVPNTPGVISGVVNFHGKIVPVVNIRRRFGLPSRRIIPSDQLIIAHTRRRMLVVCVDSVEGVVENVEKEMIFADLITSATGSIAGIVKLSNGMIFIHDLDRCLSLDEENVLDQALAIRANIHQNDC